MGAFLQRIKAAEFASSCQPDSPPLPKFAFVGDTPEFKGRELLDS